MTDAATAEDAETDRTGPDRSGRGDPGPRRPDGSATPDEGAENHHVGCSPSTDAPASALPRCSESTRMDLDSPNR